MSELLIKVLTGVDDVIRSCCDPSGTFYAGTPTSVERLAQLKADFDNARSLTPKTEMPDPLTELVLRSANALHFSELMTRQGGGAIDEDIMRSVAEPRHWTMELRQRVTTILDAAGWTMCTIQAMDLDARNVTYSAWKPPVTP